MSGFSKLGITLTSVFSFLLLALLAEILYLLYRRRRLSHRNTRIEPAGAKNTPAQEIPGSHALKLDAIYGPSRVLFTIKEEEREEVETELEISSVSLEDKKTGVTLGEHMGDYRFQVAGVSPEVVLFVGDPDLDSDPLFSTPCASPPYFTPSSSPSRERK